MNHPVKGIDHTFILVRDLEGAARRYAELGFTVSPRGLHSASKGSANHTIMFPGDYFELLGLLEKTPSNKHRFEMLERMGEGLHAIACRIDDAERGADALKEIGLATEELGSFERPVPLPDGGEGIAAFTTVSFSKDEVPFGMVFMCQHRTRETVWLPELIEHPNTACGLEAVLALSEDPNGEAAGFARLWADGRIDTLPGGARIATGVDSAELLLMAPSLLGETYPWLDPAGLPKKAFAGLRIAVRDLDKANSVLDEAKIRSHRTELGVGVTPQDACGAVIEFVERKPA